MDINELDKREFRITALRVPLSKPMDLNDGLRINLWHLEITDRSFNILDIKRSNMEELTEVTTAAEFHPHQCKVFVYSSSKGTIGLCGMCSSALCDRHAEFF
jgi:serine/threonine-protein phosphatase 2A regulatory subunit B